MHIIAKSLFLYFRHKLIRTRVFVDKLSLILSKRIRAYLCAPFGLGRIFLSLLLILSLALQPVMGAQINDSIFMSPQADPYSLALRSGLGDPNIEITITDEEAQDQLVEDGVTEDLAALNTDPDQAQVITRDERNAVDFYVSDQAVKAAVQGMIYLGQALAEAIETLTSQLVEDGDFTPEEAERANRILAKIESGELSVSDLVACGSDQSWFQLPNIFITTAYAAGNCEDIDLMKMSDEERKKCLAILVATYRQTLEEIRSAHKNGQKIDFPDWVSTFAEGVRALNLDDPEVVKALEAVGLVGSAYRSIIIYHTIKATSGSEEEADKAVRIYLDLMNSAAEISDATQAFTKEEMITIGEQNGWSAEDIGDAITAMGGVAAVAALLGATKLKGTKGGIGLPSPDYKVPGGYNVTVNSNGSATVTGPRGATYNSTGRYSADGKPIYRSEGGGYVTLDGGRAEVRAPTDYTSVPIHHVCTNKCNVGTGGNPAWTPEFQRVFDNAGLNINGEINKIAVPGHRGPHPQAYHQYVYGNLTDATRGLNANTPEYTQAVTNTLNRLKAEAVTPGSQVNRWLTGQ